MIIVKRHSNKWCDCCGNKTENTAVLFRYTDENGRTSTAGGSLVSLCDKCALELIGRLSAALYKESEE